MRAQTTRKCLKRRAGVDLGSHIAALQSAKCKCGTIILSLVHTVLFGFF